MGPLVSIILLLLASAACLIIHRHGRRKHGSKEFHLIFFSDESRELDIPKLKKEISPSGIRQVTRKDSTGTI